MRSFNKLPKSSTCQRFRYTAVACLSLTVMVILMASILEQVPKPILSPSDRKNIKEILKKSINNTPIFFIGDDFKTTAEGDLILDQRRACAIEAACKNNPNSNIFVLFTMRANLRCHLHDLRFLCALKRYQNLDVLYINLKKYHDRTPTGFFISNQIETKNRDVKEFNYILPLLTLWKFGGIYLDFDILTLKSFDELPEDYINLDLDLFKFPRDEIGHSYISKFLRYYTLGFQKLTDVLDAFRHDYCEYSNFCDELVTNEEFVKNSVNISDTDNRFGIRFFRFVPRLPKKSSSDYMKLILKSCPVIVDQVWDYF